MARKILLPSNKKGVLRKKKTDTITIDKRRYFLCCKRTRIKGINAGEREPRISNDRKKNMKRKEG